MEQLKSWLRERHQIAVAVYSTPAAEAVLAKNGLTIVDFLRPMSLVNKLNVPMRVGELSYRVQEVKLGLYAGESMFQPKAEVIDQALGQLLSLQAQRHTTLQPLPNLIQQVQSDAPESINPWFYACQSEFLRLLRFTEHEALDHPVAGIFCILADNPQALQIAQKLLNPDSQLPLQASQSMLPLQDPMFAKHFVLVQDVAAGMDDTRAKANLTALSNAYGASSCSILRLYGGSTGGAAAAAAVPAAVFTACRHANLPGGGAGEPERHPKEPPGGIGHSITADDMAAAGQLLRDFCERTLLPKLEERIARLNLIISNARKGFKNKLTRLWKGAGTETVQYQDVAYPYHSIESQMRCVADLAYLLGQYDFAVQMYRLAAQDYLAAPNSRWYAGAEEMIGICSVVTSNPNADPIKYFNRAFEHYSKVRGRQARMLATRVMLITAAYQAATGRHLAANVSLMRAHYEEERSRAALLLEAAAYELLRCRPPSARKAAFHLVLAGLRYQSAQQRRLSIHCYMQVTGIYSASSWRHISEHLHDILGKQCFELGDTQGALRHCMALLDCGHRPAAAQSQYLTRFLEAVQAAGVIQPIKDLALPSITTNTIVVRHANQRCYPTNTQQQQQQQAQTTDPTPPPPAAAAGGQSGDTSAAVWGQLEQLIAGGEASSTNWLEGAKQVYEGEEFNTVAAGEDIGIEVTFRNPLAVKLTLSRVRLIVQFTAAGAAAAGVPAAAAADESAAAAAGPSPDQVAVVESQLSLHPGEVLTERLLLRPAAAGWVRVMGVAWTLAGIVDGYCLFDIKGRRRKRPKGDRPSQQKHYPPGRRLLFHVLKGMPRLSVSLEGLPNEAAAGELIRVQVSVKNVGLAPAQSLKVAISSPHVALAAAAAGSGRSGDIWQQLQASDVVLQPLGVKATHRRHQSSGAALISGSAAAAAAAAAADKRGVSESGGRSAAAGGGDRLHQLQQNHMPHVHSLPAVAEAAAAAAPGMQGYSGPDPPVAAAAGSSTTAVFQLGQNPDLQLDPGQGLSIPMWIHIPQQSNTLRFTFHGAWYCEPPAAAAAAAMRYRVLLTQHSVSVTSLLDLQPSVSPDVKDLHKYNLRLEAACSKDAGSGVLVVQQLSCLTAGADVGWRLGNFAAAAAATGSGSAQRSLCPGLRLTPGESCTHYIQLVSPAAAAAAATGAAASSSSNQDLTVSVQKGPLRYFYRQGSPTVFGSSGGAAAGGGGDNTSLLLQQPAAAAAAETQPRQPSLVAEPPVDLLVLWRFEPAAAAAGSSMPQQQQQVRAGLISYYNLCDALRLNPIRMNIDGPGMTAPVKHDFRSASLCIVPLKLGLRNCGVTNVSATVRASAAWEGLANNHAWFATHTAPGSKHIGLLGPAAAAAAAAGSGAVSSSPHIIPAAAAAAGLPPRPKTPTAAAAAGAGGAALAGGLISSLPGVSGFVPGAFVAGATEGLGAVLGGLNLGGVRGSSPIRGADSSSSSSPAAAAAPGPFSSVSSHLAAVDSPSRGAAAAAAAAGVVQAGLAPSDEHIWCGPTCVPIRQLAPGGSVEVVLQIGVFRPGVYVVDDYGVDWRCEGLSAGRVRQGSKVGEAIVLRVEGV